MSTRAMAIPTKSFLFSSVQPYKYRNNTWIRLTIASFQILSNSQHISHCTNRHCIPHLLKTSLNRPHGVTFQKTVFLIFTTIRTSNLTIHFLKMQAADQSETLLPIYQSTRRRTFIPTAVRKIKSHTSLDPLAPTIIRCRDNIKVGLK